MHGTRTIGARPAPQVIDDEAGSRGEFIANVQQRGGAGGIEPPSIG